VKKCAFSSADMLKILFVATVNAYPLKAIFAWRVSRESPWLKGSGSAWRDAACRLQGAAIVDRIKIPIPVENGHADRFMRSS